MGIIDKARYIKALEIELKTYKKAKVKRNPENAQDAVSWHILSDQITWLEVHIGMLKSGAYDIKE